MDDNGMRQWRLTNGDKVLLDLIIQLHRYPAGSQSPREFLVRSTSERSRKPSLPPHEQARYKFLSLVIDASVDSMKSRSDETLILYITDALKHDLTSEPRLRELARNMVAILKWGDPATVTQADQLVSTSLVQRKRLTDNWAFDMGVLETCRHLFLRWHESNRPRT